MCVCVCVCVWEPDKITVWDRNAVHERSLCQTSIWHLMISTNQTKTNQILSIPIERGATRKRMWLQKENQNCNKSYLWWKKKKPTTKKETNYTTIHIGENVWFWPVHVIHFSNNTQNIYGSHHIWCLVCVWFYYFREAAFHLVLGYMHIKHFISLHFISFPMGMRHDEIHVNDRHVVLMCIGCMWQKFVFIEMPERQIEKIYAVHSTKLWCNWTFCFLSLSLSDDNLALKMIWYDSNKMKITKISTVFTNRLVVWHTLKMQMHLVFVRFFSPEIKSDKYRVKTKTKKRKKAWNGTTDGIVYNIAARCTVIIH